MRNTLKTSTGYINFSWKKSIWLYLMIAPVLLIDFTSITSNVIWLSIGITFITVGIGHSIGLHRGIIHKSYTTSSIFRNISLYCFVFTGLGSPLSWLSNITIEIIGKTEMIVQDIFNTNILYLPIFGGIFICNFLQKIFLYITFLKKTQKTP